MAGAMKKAKINLSFKGVLADESAQAPNTETMWLDGDAYVIPYGKDCIVPVELAEHLKEQGRIIGYTLVK